MDWYITEIAALGRPFQLGDLYDYRNDTICKGIYAHYALTLYSLVVCNRFEQKQGCFQQLFAHIIKDFSWLISASRLFSFLPYLVNSLSLNIQFLFTNYTCFKFTNSLLYSTVDQQWTESDLRPEPTVYAEPNLKLICPPHETSKFEEMDLDEHTQTSVSVELIKGFSGSSKYLNDRLIPTQATFTFIFRLISTRKHLDVPSIVCKSLATTPNTHVVAGIIYGVSAYCVLMQNFNESEEDRTEIIENLSQLADKMKKSLLNNQDVMEFKQQLTVEEKRKVDAMKCRLYSDLPTDSDCNVYEAYEHYYQLIDGIDTGATTSKSVPISVLLCPLSVQVIETPQGKQIKTSGEYNKDVDYSLVEQYCCFYDKLGRIRAKSEDYRNSTNNHSSLRQFESTIAKYQEILTNSMKKAVVKARRWTIIDNEEVEKVLKIAENHKFFQPSQLKQWLNRKKSELNMLKWMANIPGIFLMLDDKKLKEELEESFDRKNVLVLSISDLDNWTSSAFGDMESYVKSRKKFDYDFKEMAKDSEKDIPSRLNENNKDLDNIHKLIRHVDRSKHLEKKADYFITTSSEWANEDYNYFFYKAGNHVWKNRNQLPSPPNNLKIEHGGSPPIFLLHWDYKDLGFPCHFVVQYRLKGTSDKSWEEKRTMDVDQTEMYIRITNGSVMEFRMATESGFGVSEFSDIVEFGIDGEEDLVSARKRKRPCSPDAPIYIDSN